MGNPGLRSTVTTASVGGVLARCPHGRWIHRAPAVDTRSGGWRRRTRGGGSPISACCACCIHAPWWSERSALGSALPGQREAELWRE